MRKNHIEVKYVIFKGLHHITLVIYELGTRETRGYVLRTVPQPAKIGSLL